MMRMCSQGRRDMQRWLPRGIQRAARLGYPRPCTQTPDPPPMFIRSCPRGPMELILLSQWSAETEVHGELPARARQRAACLTGGDATVYVAHVVVGYAALRRRAARPPGTRGLRGLAASGDSRPPGTRGLRGLAASGDSRRPGTRGAAWPEGCVRGTRGLGARGAGGDADRAGQMRQERKELHLLLYPDPGRCGRRQVYTAF